MSKYYEHDLYSHPAILYDKSSNGNKETHCKLCSHYCDIKEGNVGTCLLRKNIDGELFTMSWGRTEGLAVDPIEKKPFYHFKPASKVLSFGTPGCNFKCMNCQNWQLSQAVKNYSDEALRMNILKPGHIAEYASLYRLDGIAYTYSEPTIFFEYARDTIHACRKNKKTENIFHVFVSNGFFSKETFDLIDKENLLQAINIDLKFMDDKKYRKISGGELQPVLDSIKRVADMKEKIHMEIINLIIPGENDSDDDIEKLCDFIYSLSPDIPLHFSRFYPHYKFSGKPATSLVTLKRAREIAIKQGLHYIYIGNTNIPGAEDTHCPKCNQLLISRTIYGITKNNIIQDQKSGKPLCPDCKTEIPVIM